MYTREQASQIKQAFWTTFGQYVSPHRSAEGLKTNWVNYKTGLKHVYFRMQADKKLAWIAIEITHVDEGIQELFFEQFLEFKTLLHEYLGEEWEWQLHDKDDNNKTISRIYTQLPNVSIFNKDDWPQLISFFKPRIFALDRFWSDVKDGFDALRY